MHILNNEPIWSCWHKFKIKIKAKTEKMFLQTGRPINILLWILSYAEPHMIFCEGDALFCDENVNSILGDLY